jgi:hypothetical protein
MGGLCAYFGRGCGSGAPFQGSRNFAAASNLETKRFRLVSFLSAAGDANGKRNSLFLSQILFERAAENGGEIGFDLKIAIFGFPGCGWAGRCGAARRISRRWRDSLLFGIRFPY